MMVFAGDPRFAAGRWEFAERLELLSALVDTAAHREIPLGRFRDYWKRTPMGARYNGRAMANLLISIGAYIGVVAALGVAVALMARREGFRDIRDDEI